MPELVASRSFALTMPTRKRPNEKLADRVFSDRKIMLFSFKGAGQLRSDLHFISPGPHRSEPAHHADRHITSFARHNVFGEMQMTGREVGFIEQIADIELQFEWMPRCSEGIGHPDRETVRHICRKACLHALGTRATVDAERPGDVRVGAITRSGIFANVVMTGALVVLVYFADRAALSLFLGNKTETIDIAQHINAVVSWGFVMFGVMMVIFGTVRATGAVIPPLIIVTLSLVGVRVGITAFLEPTLGEEAIWWSYPISSAVSMVLAIGYYRFGKWREATMLTGSQPPPHPARNRARCQPIKTELDWC